MGTKYTLRVKNDSQQTGSVYVYESCPDQNSQKLCSLAWFSKECHTGTEVSFEWDNDSYPNKAEQNSLHGTVFVTPYPTYWIRFGNFEEGQVLDVNNISQDMKVVFAPNVYEQSFTFTENNEWKVTGKNIDTGSGGGLYDTSGFEKANSDILEKFYEKSNYICGYGCLTKPEPFDDFVHITKLSIWSGEILDGLEVTYSNGKTYKHGCTYGACQTLELGEDSIVGMEWYYSVTGSYLYNAISNMIITTHFGKRFGPFGFVATGSEGKFSMGKENCYIAILFGIAHTPEDWGRQVINSIGGYYVQF